ncbi:hypothetical protein STEG23_026558 [Scotinomys teguina]
MAGSDECTLFKLLKKNLPGDSTSKCDGKFSENHNLENQCHVDNSAKFSSQVKISSAPLDYSFGSLIFFRTELLANFKPEIMMLTLLDSTEHIEKNETVCRATTPTSRNETRHQNPSVTIDQVLY